VNEVRDATCKCRCNLTCPAGKKESDDNTTCQCVCIDRTCPGPNFVKNDATCGCDCPITCPNGQKLNLTACECADCVGNWVKNVTTGLCTVCPALTCQGSERVDTTACRCVCDTLNCTGSLVVDQFAVCACRNCTVGECVCGNGVIETSGGEECDFGAFPRQCCVNCKWSKGPCNDDDLCTDGDTCDGAGTCVGDYKCPQNTECATISCNSTIGTCDMHPYPNGTGCGDQPYNLCNSRCINGYCITSPLVCPPDNSPSDCIVPVCDGATGTCPYRNTSGSSCSDGNACTSDDTCVNGACQGTLVTCPTPSNPCQTSACQFGSCVITDISGIPCDADNDLCTVDDLCVQGRCVRGEKTVCNVTEQCKKSLCEPTTGECVLSPIDANITCNDGNVCTMNDICVNGTCIGETDPTLAQSVECGFVPSSPVTNSIIIFSVAGAAALIGAIVGMAFLIKKIRDSKLTDPDTWNPEAFNSIGANPLYKGSSKVVDNRLYEGGN